MKDRSGAVGQSERERTQAWLRRLDERRKTLADEVEEDAAPIRGLTPGVMRECNHNLRCVRLRRVKNA